MDASNTDRRDVALVTGASSGIGAAFATMLAASGHDVVLVARRAERLCDLADELTGRHSVTATAIPADLATEGSAQTLVDDLAHRGMGIDVLVNNAGSELDGRFLDNPWARHEDHARLLALTPAELIHLCLPWMLERRRGRIINVASIGGLLPCAPYEGLYSPSKHFLVSLTRALAIEYRNTGVTFTVSCPGGTATELIERGNAARYTARLPKGAIQSADAVATDAWRAAVAGKVVTVPGVANKLAALAMRLAPEQLSHHALRAASASAADAG